jgi:hypothetical protein
MGGDARTIAASAQQRGVTRLRNAGHEIAAGQALRNLCVESEQIRGPTVQAGA